MGKCTSVSCFDYFAKERCLKSMLAQLVPSSLSKPTWGKSLGISCDDCRAGLVRLTSLMTLSRTPPIVWFSCTQEQFEICFQMFSSEAYAHAHRDILCYEVVDFSPKWDCVSNVKRLNSLVFQMFRVHTCLLYFGEIPFSIIGRVSVFCGADARIVLVHLCWFD